MSTIHRHIHIHAPADIVWDALRDVGRPHERLTPGVLVDASFDGQTRTVTFADGFVARERIVDVDDDEMRVAYAVVDGPFAESKELVGGFVILELDSRAEAVDWAKRYAAVLGEVELDILPVASLTT